MLIERLVLFVDLRQVLHRLAELLEASRRVFDTRERYLVTDTRYLQQPLEERIHRHVPRHTVQILQRLVVRAVVIGKFYLAFLDRLQYLVVGLVDFLVLIRRTIPLHDACLTIDQSLLGAILNLIGTSHVEVVFHEVRLAHVALQLVARIIEPTQLFCALVNIGISKVRSDA